MGFKVDPREKMKNRISLVTIDQLLLARTFIGG